MDIYFNPYPGAARTEDEGLHLAVSTADALLRLQKGCVGVILSGNTLELDFELPPSKFVLVRNKEQDSTIGSLIYKTGNVEREKLRLLLDLFSKGKIISNDELLKVDNWIVSAIGTSAPMLELAARNNAIALTIPTELEWRIDLIRFDERPNDTLHNLWGQVDISAIISHCLDSISNYPERFCAQFNAIFCTGVLNSAPNPLLWDNFGIFHTMEKAQKRNYYVDNDLIKYVQGTERTKFGPLLELRCKGSGYRLLFIYRKDNSPEIIIGGFYKKGTGDDSKAQNEAIQQANKRINDYSVDL